MEAGKRVGAGGGKMSTVKEGEIEPEGDEGQNM